MPDAIRCIIGLVVVAFALLWIASMAAKDNPSF